MASKKTSKAKAKKERVGKDDLGEAKAALNASKKPKPAKAAKKAAAVKLQKAAEEVQKKAAAVKAAEKAAAVKAAKKATAKGADKGAGKGAAKHDSAKHHKIRVPGTVGKKDADGTAAAELDPFEVAKQRVKGSVPAIVDAMVEKAKQGSYTHAKTLLEMTGARHMFDGEGEAQESGEPWAKLVLERLDEADGRESAALHQEAQEAAVER